ncbi:hypothetical protein MYK68_13995 [Gordonia sp. PP30]|uniref:hypothetical protein n=1 Tax=Gordonia sp. PP30 TaxID=2935861 RepID=UPI001FFEF59B|nr:hypothetical protein [Gordonia sp. PP30]UQE73842.1 hypothetical protein MYK68_13995 [Gordonia sp. PP30]
MPKKIRFNKNAFREIMTSPEMAQAVGAEVGRIAGRLDPDDYEHVVEPGGDRVRGAVWTKTDKAKRRTARDGELLHALGGHQ